MFSRKLDIKLRLSQLLFLLIIFSSNHIISQENNQIKSSEDVMTSVYEDVWKPFMESYRELDIEKFKSLQADDLTRVSIDRNTIPVKSQYFQEIEGFFNQFKQAKRQLDIKFSILSSAVGEGKIYQTGYYSVGSRTSEADSVQTMGYGYFTVVLIKEDGKWKISLDADKRATINEGEFRKSGVVYEMK